MFAKENKNQINDYSDQGEEGKEKVLNEKLSELYIHHLIIQIKLKELLWDFDALSLYPSAMWDENSI